MRDGRKSGHREAWVHIPSEAEARESGKLQNYDYGFGFLPAMTRMGIAHDLIGPAYLEIFRQTMFAPGHLERWEREMLAAVTSAAGKCFYWSTAHAEVLRVELPDHDLVEAIKKGSWRQLSHLSERTRALCTIAEKITVAPSEMVEEDWQPLRDLGFDDRAIIEVAHLVGFFNYALRVADSLGVKLDARFMEAHETHRPLQRAE
jgi:uncharacterized peroxidase-related enzyme